jgi:hypothetical protein
MPVMRDILNSTGQERTAWLNRTLKPAEEALRYYLGPDVARAGSSLGQLLTEMSPAADIRDMAQSSRDLMGSGSPMDAAGNAAMLGAAVLGLFTPGSASSVKRASSDGVDAIVKALREGRAGEVTDDMLGALSPQQNAMLHDAYVRGETGADMAMDEASRMARAKEMGFDVDTPLYHGSENLPFDRFESGYDGASAAVGRPGLSNGDIYLAPDIDHARVYGEPSNALFAKGGRDSVNVRPDLEDWAGYEGSSSAQEMINDMYDGDFFTAASFDDTLKDAATTSRSGGASGVDVSAGGLRSSGFSPDTTIMFNPRDIRSASARFDPRLKNLSNLSAAVPGLFGAGTLGALLAARDDEVQQ